MKFSYHPTDHLSPSACWNCHAMQLFRTRLVLVFSFSGLPSPPLTPSYNVGQYGRDSVMLTVQWQPSLDDGGAPVNYTITVSPGATEVTTSSTGASLPDIPYNVTNTISIVATNCIGNSSVVMETIRIGKLQCSLWSTLYLHVDVWEMLLAAIANMRLWIGNLFSRRVHNTAVTLSNVDECSRFPACGFLAYNFQCGRLSFIYHEDGLRFSRSVYIWRFVVCTDIFHPHWTKNTLSLLFLLCPSRKRRQA